MIPLQPLNPRLRTPGIICPVSVEFKNRDPHPRDHRRTFSALAVCVPILAFIRLNKAGKEKAGL